MIKRLLTEAETVEFLESLGVDYTLAWLRKKRRVGGGIPYRKVDGSKIRYERLTIERWLFEQPEFISTSDESARRAA